MSAFVLDVSIALTWCFEDEAGPETDHLLERAALEGAMAPTLFALELGNALVMALRRGRIAPGQLEALVARIAALPLALEPVATLPALSELLKLAQDERLTAYDAAYLDLALEHGLPLATRDAALAAAAARRGVLTLGVGR